MALATVVNIKVGRFSNVTLDVLPLLNAPPKTRWTHQKVVKKGKTVWEPVEVQRDEENRLCVPKTLCGLMT
jgi:hypothetical protein